jgi:hypothetical protein
LTIRPRFDDSLTFFSPFIDVGPPASQGMGECETGRGNPLKSDGMPRMPVARL